MFWFEVTGLQKGPWMGLQKGHSEEAGLYESTKDQESHVGVARPIQWMWISGCSGHPDFLHG